MSSEILWCRAGQNEGGGQKSFKLLSKVVRRIQEGKIPLLSLVLSLCYNFENLPQIGILIVSFLNTALECEKGEQKKKLPIRKSISLSEGGWGGAGRCFS